MTKPRTISRERKHRNKPYPDRIYRGRILAAIRTKKASTMRSLAHIVDPTYISSLDATWLRGMAARLVRDGLLAQQGERLLLPTAKT